LILRSSKSGKEWETVFIPQKVADHFREYLISRGTGSDQRIFPIFCKWKWQWALGQAIRLGNLG
ncbi:MAG: hypothetical protein ACXVAB_16195, partial [Thermodesulfobacteriota bacterium]